MKRIRDIGMNCGVEYTSFPLFKNLGTYSRYDHSLGCALIVWHFTKDRKQTLAALFHDIATPVFAHSIDFMNGDYLKQESYEEKTGEILRNSREINSLLTQMNISFDDVADYHRYPIADNDSPKLSSDRLEYTLSNSFNYGFAEERELKELYEDLTVSINEENEEELVFKDLNRARRFGDLSLKCSNFYIADEDRYAMEMIAELMKEAIRKKILSYDDLYTNEKEVIKKIQKSNLKKSWDDYTCLIETVRENHPSSKVIDAKKRFINPYVLNKGRLMDLDLEYNFLVCEFLNRSLDYPIRGIGKRL